MSNYFQVEDYDGDHRSDLLCHYSNGTISVLYNQGGQLYASVCLSVCLRVRETSLTSVCLPICLSACLGALLSKTAVQPLSVRFPVYVCTLQSDRSIKYVSDCFYLCTLQLRRSVQHVRLYLPVLPNTEIKCPLLYTRCMSSSNIYILDL